MKALYIQGNIYPPHNFQNNFENEASNIKALIENESEIMIINETKKLDDN